MAPHREWVREFQFATWVSGQESKLDTEQTIGYVTAPDVTAKLRRIIIDASVSMRIEDTPGGGPARSWWNFVNPVFAVGRDLAPGGSNLNVTGFGDERVTGTGGLTLRSAGVGFGPNPEHYAVWGLSETVDTHGMRDPLPGATLTVAPLTVQAFFTQNIVNASMAWEFTWWAYMRVLWEIP
jgi:hypothetical protein